jgi:hypothetical protein
MSHAYPRKVKPSLAEDMSGLPLLISSFRCFDNSQNVEVPARDKGDFMSPFGQCLSRSGSVIRANEMD